MTETYRQPDAVVAEMLRTRLVPNVSVTSVEML